MEWQPIETAPENTDILTYAEWSAPSVVGVSRYRWVTEVASEVVHETKSANGRRLIIQERDERKREWEGAHWEPTHWMPLPPAPSSTQQGEGK